MPTIFFNTAWMRFYAGVTDEDSPRDGGSWEEKHEVCNFLPINGKCYGFVQPAGETIAIERIGADEGAEYLDNVTVVWSARSPSGHTVAVGIYRNARLHRNRQKLPESAVHKANRLSDYFVECAESDAILFSYKRRSHRIPRGLNGMGQSLIWYGDTSLGEEEAARIQLLISDSLELSKQAAADAALVATGDSTAGSFDEDQQAIEEDVRQIIESDLTATEKSTLVRARVGQGKFRDQVLKMWRNGCAVTGCRISAMLRASHIKPWRDCKNNSERLDPDNGLMLSANLDALFDKGLISFNDLGQMLVSPEIGQADRTKIGLGAPLTMRPNQGQARYLAYHRNFFGFGKS